MVLGTWREWTLSTVSIHAGDRKEIAMYATDVVWWGYTIFMVAVALFMLYFARKVRQKGD